MSWKPAIGWMLAAIIALAALSCSPREDRRETPEATVTSAAVATVTPSPTPEPSAAILDWEECGGLDCATLEVPLDYEGRASGTMEVPLIRHRAEDPSRRIGVLLVNPGGPGGSGVEYVRNVWWLWPDELVDSFDIIGFDPRGVSGRTAVDCMDDFDDFYDADTSPDTPEEHATLVEEYREFAEACSERSGEYLPYLGGDVVVQDIDLIRQALGEEQISFLGLSYGTYLGAKYADRYPERVRAFVLDGPTDPSLSGKDWQLQQALGFEAALHAFLADCAADTTCLLNSGMHPEAAFDLLMAQIDATPIHANGRLLGPGEARLGVTAALYNKEYGWPLLEEALSSALLRDGSGLFSLFDSYVGRGRDGSYSDFHEIYRAVSCMDLHLPDTVEGFDAMAEELSAAAPRFGAALAYEHLDCAFWPAHAPEPVAVSASGAPPILVVGTTRDPATPLVWARSLASQLESGVLVQLEGDGHVAWGSSQCIDSIVVDYLVDLEVPPEGTTCR